MLIECIELKEHSDLKIFGYLENIHTFNTKKGDQMATLSFVDETSSIDVTLFHETYKQYKLDLKVRDFVKNIVKKG